MKLFTASFSIIALELLLSVTTIAQTNPAYLDPTQPIDTRVADLISRMTLEEKASQLDHKAPGTARLQIPTWGTWNQSLHGIWSKSRPTTLFPTSIAMAATWDPALVPDSSRRTL